MRVSPGRPTGEEVRTPLPELSTWAEAMAVPGPGQRIVFLGESERLVSRAHRSIEEDRAARRSDISQRLRADARAEVGRDHARLCGAAEAAYRAAARSTLRGLDEAFFTHAETVGPMWTELSVLVGFPDPDPTGRRPQGPEPFFRRGERARAQGLREGIASQDTAYRRHVGSELEADLQVLRSRLTELEAARILALEAAERAAEREAERLSPAGEPIATGPGFPEALTMPRVSGATLTVSSPDRTGAARPAPSARPRVWGRVDRARAQATLFARMHGAALDDGAPDRTDEFETWRRAFRAGR